MVHRRDSVKSISVICTPWLSAPMLTPLQCRTQRHKPVPQKFLSLQTSAGACPWMHLMMLQGSAALRGQPTPQCHRNFCLLRVLSHSPQCAGDTLACRHPVDEQVAPVQVPVLKLHRLLGHCQRQHSLKYSSQIGILAHCHCPEEGTLVLSQASCCAPGCTCGG